MEDRCFGCWDVFRRGENLSEDDYCKHCEDERAIQDSIDRTEAYEYEKEKQCSSGSETIPGSRLLGP